MVIFNEIQFYQIPNFEGYYISTCGKVLSTRGNGKGPCKIKNARILKANVNSRGYKYVILCKNNKKETKRIHRLVAMTFLEDFNNPNLTVDHKDNDKLNNNLHNLKMATRSEQDRNKKSAAGVCKVFDKNQNTYSWRAYWTHETGREKVKCFSVNKYGELFAYLLASDLRQAMVEKYYNRP